MTIRHIQITRSTLAAFLGMSLLGCLVTLANAADPIDERLGNPQYGYWDAEVWGPTLQIAYQDSNHVVWIANLDPNNGRMIPRDGHGVRVGQSIPVVQLGWPMSFNGPEWGISQTGLAVFFTQLDDRGIAQIARHRLSDGVTQQITAGGRHHRIAALPSENLLDSETTVLSAYVDGLKPILSWRRETEPRTDRIIPVEKPSSNGPRWIPRQYGVLTNILDDQGVVQIASYDLNTQELKVLTGGPGDKVNPSIWDAPEYAPGRGLLTEINGVGLAIYRETLEGWVLESILPQETDPDSGRMTNYFDSKVFVFQGQSYLLTAVQQPVRFPFLTGFGDIYVYSLDGQRRIKLNHTKPRTRNRDPEFLITDTDVWVYYYSLLAGEEPAYRLARRFIEHLEPIED